jgi:hypothetical protein
MAVRHERARWLWLWLCSAEVGAVLAQQLEAGARGARGVSFWPPLTTPHVVWLAAGFSCTSREECLSSTGDSSP